MAVELFANVPSAVVTSGGTTAPAAGTTEAWTANAASAFPAVSSSAAPPTQFHVADEAAGTEMILVTSAPGGTGSQSWMVTRGAEGTTPVAHTAGFTVTQVATGGALGQLRVTDWLNVKTMFGAAGNGSTDDTTVIQAALNAGSAGQVVYFPAGVYVVSSPLTIPAGIAFMGSARGMGIPVGNYGAGGLPLIGSVIQPASGFSGSAALYMTDDGVHQTGQQQLYRITVDGSSLPAGSVHGIQAVGAVAAVTMRDVLVYRVTGNGLDAQIGGGAANPDFWDVAHCKFSGTRGSWGVNTAGMADSWFTSCEATGGVGGIQVVNGNSTKFIGTRAASNSGTGWALTGGSGFTGVVTLTACAAELNGTGWVFSGSGTGTYVLNGCPSEGNTTSFTYAGSNTLHTSAAWNASTSAPTFQ